METRVTEIADGIHQLTTYVAEMDFGFNQYLVTGDEPLLFHTGPRQLFPLVSAAVARFPQDGADAEALVVAARAALVGATDRSSIVEVMGAEA